MRLPALAADLVAAQVGRDRRAWRRGRGSQSMRPERCLSSSSLPHDPVRLGFVASLARPGGNVTGVFIFTMTTSNGEMAGTSA